MGEVSDNLINEQVENPKNTAYRIWLNENKTNYSKQIPKNIDSISADSLHQKKRVKEMEDSIQKTEKKVFLSGYTEKDNIEGEALQKTESSLTSNQKTELNFGVNYFVFPQVDNSLLNNYLYQSNVILVLLPAFAIEATSRLGTA